MTTSSITASDRNQAIAEGPRDISEAPELRRVPSSMPCMSSEMYAQCGIKTRKIAGAMTRTTSTFCASWPKCSMSTRNGTSLVERRAQIVSAAPAARSSAEARKSSLPKASSPARSSSSSISKSKDQQTPSSEASSWVSPRSASVASDVPSSLFLGGVAVRPGIGCDGVLVPILSPMSGTPSVVDRSSRSGDGKEGPGEVENGCVSSARSASVCAQSAATM
mmetsp:Transcript_55014/g.178154  ORF Transcript_55014/g.178154 Transcript_55014/m.178154 type:complete len:221 (-) Transcript_55014:56-718(-)